MKIDIYQRGSLFLRDIVEVLRYIKVEEDVDKVVHIIKYKTKVFFKGAPPSKW